MDLVHTTKFSRVLQTYFALHSFRVRIPYPFQWGGPTFDAGDVFGVMTAAFASLIEVGVLCIGSHVN